MNCEFLFNVECVFNVLWWVFVIVLVIDKFSFILLFLCFNLMKCLKMCCKLFEEMFLLLLMIDILIFGFLFLMCSIMGVLG